MARIHWFIHAISASIFAAVAWSMSVRDFAVAISEGWPAYHPSPGESIALDVAARELVDHRQLGILSRFAEFIRRAFAHDDYSAGHFDPGRMPA